MTAFGSQAGFVCCWLPQRSAHPSLRGLGGPSRPLSCPVIHPPEHWVLACKGRQAALCAPAAPSAPIPQGARPAEAVVSMGMRPGPASEAVRRSPHSPRAARGGSLPTEGALPASACRQAPQLKKALKGTLTNTGAGVGGGVEGVWAGGALTPAPARDRRKGRVLAWAGGRKISSAPGNSPANERLTQPSQ